ncbi:MAG TPA: hypothetical protein VEU50_24685 [Archangium sp.]|nr:hypothetical protein [Archangium sp.]HYO55983.1 hypothetical protein [Archangium sp.]
MGLEGGELLREPFLGLFGELLPDGTVLGVAPGALFRVEPAAALGLGGGSGGLGIEMASCRACFSRWSASSWLAVNSWTASLPTLRSSWNRVRTSAESALCGGEASFSMRSNCRRLSERTLRWAAAR